MSTTTAPMPLGNFSVSLSVANLEASSAFYRKLGFSQIGGDASRNWLIVRNGNATLGLFQGMFPRNTLTFNPGWDANGTNLAEFVDIRELEKRVKSAGVELVTATDAGDGPASFMVIDPDGNPILVDQHV